MPVSTLRLATADDPDPSHGTAACGAHPLGARLDTTAGTMDTNCTDRCRLTLIETYADLGIEVNTSTNPPLFPSAYATQAMVCPHGVVYYSEPTAEQKIRWAETRTP